MKDSNELKHYKYLTFDELSGEDNLGVTVDVNGDSVLESEEFKLVADRVERLLGRDDVCTTFVVVTSDSVRPISGPVVLSIDSVDGDSSFVVLIIWWLESVTDSSALTGDGTNEG